MQSTKEAALFVDINCKQVRVTRRLLNELYANLTWDSEDFDERMLSLNSRIVTSLDTRKNSPLYDRIILTNKDKSKFRCLTLTSLSDGLKENKFFGSEQKVGPFIDSKMDDLEFSKEKSVKILSRFLSLFSEAMPEHWNLGDDKGGYLCTNNALRSLLKVFREVIDFISYKNSLDFDTCTADEIIDYTKNYFKPVIEFFINALPEEIANYRSRQALKGVRINALHMMFMIHSEFNDFLPTSLKEFIETVDVDGTNDALQMINDIQEKLFCIVIENLRAEFGEERWWYDGVPQKTRTECSRRQEEDSGKKDKEQYLLLIDYKKIAHSNWGLFSKYFSFLRNGNKDVQLGWLDKLNPIRNITHHREKWPATKEQVKFVREIHAKVMSHFVLENKE